MVALDTRHFYVVVISYKTRRQRGCGATQRQAPAHRPSAPAESLITVRKKRIGLEKRGLELEKCQCLLDVCVVCAHADPQRLGDINDATA